MKYFLNINKLVITLVLLLSFSCKKETTQVQNDIQTLDTYASVFDLIQKKDHKELRVYSPFPNTTDEFIYYLVNKNTDLSQFKKGSKIIKTPIEKIVVTSTTNIASLELLKAENTLVGFPHSSFISSEKTRARIDAGYVKELGIDADLNTEIIYELNPDVVIAYAMTSGNKSLLAIERANIPVLYNGAWLEKTPLGRAEWIKVFGALYEKEKLADSIFNTIVSNYNNAKAIAKKSQNSPTILSGAMFKDIWNLPAGESYVAHFFADANTNYLWKETKGTGSLQLGFENVLDKGQHADLWVSPGYFATKQELENASGLYKHFKAFEKNEIYTFSNKKGTTGGVIYYEQGPTRPDLVLKDIIKIAHPKLLPNYELTYYSKME